MRIVWPAAYYGPHRGSFVPAVESVARRATARGDTFDVILPDIGGVGWYGDLRSAGANVHLVPPYDPRAAALRALRLAPDVVHAHFDGWLVTLTLTLWPGRARILWHMHQAFTTGTEAVRRTAKRTIKYRAVGRRVFRFVCVTETIAQHVRNLGAPPARVVTLHNAVDGARFRHPDASERAAARAGLGLDGDGPAVAFFGRDPAIKGADVLAGALGEIPGITIVAVATPDAALARIAREANVVSVPFAADVRKVLWAVDALALPSRGEGMPYVALEALACGVPVVASDLPWAVELARGTDGVALAAAGDARGFARALRQTIAARPRVRSGERGDLDAWAAQILGYYDEGRPRAPAQPLGSRAPSLE